MITRTIKAEVKPTIEELANEFSNANSEEQALFLNIVAKNFASWGDTMKPYMQMLNIADEKCLSDEAKKFVYDMNDYINKI